MASLLRVDGTWPGTLRFTAGWYRAKARPWNTEVPDPMIRVDRGGVDFLVSIVDRLRTMGAEKIYSPALFPTTTRMWRRAGFADHARLDIMERAVAASPRLPDDGVIAHERPDWGPILEIDREAFEGFWRMSATGLSDAFETNKASVLLTTGTSRPTGYALLGAQWGVAYLHRIAVHPESSGKGIGQRLIAAALDWSHRHGARTMILNVRPENAGAIRFYDRAGFVRTGSQLEVLRLSPGQMLN